MLVYCLYVQELVDIRGVPKCIYVCHFQSIEFIADNANHTFFYWIFLYIQWLHSLSVSFFKFRRENLRHGFENRQ